MAAYPYRKPRPGTPRPVRFAATVMFLLVLAAGALFSAGSDHHRRAPHAAAGHRAAVADPTGTPHSHTAVTEHAHDNGEAPGHEHEHGNEWTPNLAPRARPAGHATFVGVVADPGPSCPGITARHGTVLPRDADLSLLGVLRV